MSWYAGWGGPGLTRLPCAVQSVCERHTYTLPPRRASAVRGRHGSRSHIPQSIAFRRLSGGLSRLTGALAMGLEGHQRQRLEEHRCSLC
jgi:hypothetical protein